MRSTWLRNVKRLVVKVGTSTLTNGTQTLNEPRVAHLIEQIVSIRRRGVEVILVTSGAIGIGTGRLNLRGRPRDIGSLQAVAAVGQSLLMHAYETLFHLHDQPIAQTLITAGDLNDRKRYVNFSNALNSLFRYGVVPIVNENDTIAVDEIRVGDNDTLSAHVANAADADLLILLSDIEGLYTADPHRFPDAQLIHLVPEITDELLAIGQESGQPLAPSENRLGTGRLATKLRAAQIIASSGKPMILANGARPNVLLDLLAAEEVGTFFLPMAVRLCRRKQWIAHTLTPRGTLILDAGAREALLKRGRSLLPSGITGVEGDFDRGDPVRCVDAQGNEFARGLVNYDSDEIREIQGRRTDAIERVLGYRYADEVIHRDHLVLL